MMTLIHSDQKRKKLDFIWIQTVKCSQTLDFKTDLHTGYPAMKNSEERNVTVFTKSIRYKFFADQEIINSNS